MKRIVLVSLIGLMMFISTGCKLYTYRNVSGSGASEKVSKLTVTRDSYRWFMLVIYPIIIYTGSDSLFCDIEGSGDLECRKVEEK